MRMCRSSDCQSERIVRLQIRLGGVSWQIGHLGATVGDFWMDDFGIRHDENEIALELCLDCGRLQGDYPRPQTLVERKQTELLEVG